MSGRFIVFEGIDGAGKSTQIEKLRQKLVSEGRKVFITAEPTASVTGGILRDALSGNYKRSASELAAMFLSDRVFHNVNESVGINQALEKGFDVISDRYYYSSFAYQGLDSDIDWVIDMNLNCPDIRKPDLCIFLDLDAEKSKSRIDTNRATVEIFEKEEILNKIRGKFFDVFRRLPDENIAVIDASGTVDEVAEKISAVVDALQ
jgi:dTMP kinase